VVICCIATGRRTVTVVGSVYVVECSDGGDGGGGGGGEADMTATVEKTSGSDEKKDPTEVVGD